MYTLIKKMRKMSDDTTVSDFDYVTAGGGGAMAQRRGSNPLGAPRPRLSMTHNDSETSTLHLAAKQRIIFLFRYTS